MHRCGDPKTCPTHTCVSTGLQWTRSRPTVQRKRLSSSCTRFWPRSSRRKRLTPGSCKGTTRVRVALSRLSSNSAAARHAWASPLSCKEERGCPQPQLSQEGEAVQVLAVQGTAAFLPSRKPGPELRPLLSHTQPQAHATHSSAKGSEHCQVPADCRVPLGCPGTGHSWLGAGSTHSITKG